MCLRQMAARGPKEEHRHKINLIFYILRTASVLVSRQRRLADMRIISVARGKQGQPLSYFSYLSDNIMTIDEEMKELSAKAAKASRKQEKCENNTWFAIVFLNQALPRWRVKNGKTVPRCLR